MTDLNDFYPTNDVDDVLEDWIKDLIPSSFRSEYKNVETLSGTRVLLNADTPIQLFDCDGSDRIVKAPTSDAIENHPYLISNSSTGTEVITFQSNDGTVDIATIAPGKTIAAFPDGNGDYKIVLLQDTVTTQGSKTIEGMKVVYNSTNSFTVETGSCYAENGDYIDITSAITASSLSLSNSTRYYVYVYLSSGTPAVEVSTTTPTVYSGSAKSKTGDTSKRYVFDFKTDGSGNILQFQHNPSMSYVALMYAVPVFLSNGKATSYTAITSIQDYVSVYTRNLQINALNTDTSTAFINTSDTSADVIPIYASVRVVAMVPCDANQQIRYKYASTPTNGLYISLYGYYYDR